MNRRHITVVALPLLLTVAVSVGTTAYFAFRTPCAVRQFDRLALGMPRAEAEAILGPPTEMTHPELLEWQEPLSSISAPPLSVLGPPQNDLCEIPAWWRIDGCTAYVSFDQDGVRRGSTLFLRLRRWLRL